MATALIVDDEGLVRKVLCTCLVRMGFTVLEADSVDAARRLNGYTLDLLIAAQVVGDESGIAVARELRERFPALRTIITSAIPPQAWPPGDADFLSGSPRHRAAFLQKPFLADTFRHAVEDVLGQPLCCCPGC